MGIKPITLGYYKIGLQAAGIESYRGLKLCEYGNLTIEHPKFKTSKQYFENEGAYHVSIDWNGRDGALKLDLSKPISGIGEPFDMVTNCGVTEHVKESQYHAFKNMHDLVRPGGILYDSVPKTGHWKGHCYWRYNTFFFEALANANGYKIIKIGYKKQRVKRNVVVAIFIKVLDCPFMDQQSFNNLPGLYRR